MRHLDTEGTFVICVLIDKLGTRDEISLSVSDSHTLVVRRGKTLRTPFGIGQILSVIWIDRASHRCPEIRFLVMDYRGVHTELDELVCAFPMSDCHDTQEPQRHYFVIKKGRFTAFQPHGQLGLTLEAEAWMHLIKEYGYLKQSPQP